MKPFILANMAMTADGKIATANRAVSSFGSRADLENLYTLRATADAVMAGARTVAAEDADLGAGPARFRRLRIKRGLRPDNLRVVVSGRASISPRARILRERSLSPLLVLTCERAPAAYLRRLRGTACVVKVLGDEAVDLAAGVKWLEREWGVRRLLLEGGGELNSGFFRLGWIDELHLTLCPVCVGGAESPTIADGAGVARLAAASGFRFHSVRQVGQELFLVCRRAPASTQPAGGGH
jgi:2,5-diamino-6-(ribosylamino)-4(3H)-pyrimidinone 5'-phosphate reductase